MSKSCLAIIGDYWHKGPLYQRLLEDVLPAMNITAVYIEDTSRIPWDSLESFDVICITKMATTDPTVSKDVWYTEEQEEAVESYIKNGGKLFSLHAGLADYPRDGTFCGIMKGAFLYHPSEHPVFEVGSVTKNVPKEYSEIQYSIKDEMYFVYVDSSNTEVLLESRSPDYGSSPAAWRHTYENGKVFCYTPGHNNDVLANPQYKEVLKLGFSWLLE